MQRETIIIDNCTFHRYPNAKYPSDRNYFKGWTYDINGIKTKKEYLHRYIWKKHNGEIPKGYHVHHIDGDFSNNSINNLGLISHSLHIRHHYHKQSDEWKAKKLEVLLTKAVPASKAWHSSEDGNKLHSKNGKKTYLYRKVHVCVCENCGKEYKTKRSEVAKFCSDKCCAAYRRKSGIDDEIRLCPICKTEYKSNKYSFRKYCSPACSTIGRKQ